MSNYKYQQAPTTLDDIFGQMGLLWTEFEELKLKFVVKIDDLLCWHFQISDDANAESSAKLSKRMSNIEAVLGHLSKKISNPLPPTQVMCNASIGTQSPIYSNLAVQCNAVVKSYSLAGAQCNVLVKSYSSLAAQCNVAQKSYSSAAAQCKAVALSSSVAVQSEAVNLFSLPPSPGPSYSQTVSNIFGEIPGLSPIRPQVHFTAPLSAKISSKSNKSP
ncbi:hypothetical protein RSOLAG1IB_01470 [Rhizoctonia solani AG-1 IB]|uniref:Uncharacterized protein n=1 Tax=Thanatephorus cucumeris (strain AG1-IB / isolate 7/3/14) TaxID=1108050 RepID=A0A0B7FGY6_THACB|nr:hypothetical protein RSOLAG1IB_01470 [Rhizoctonia solani AG-1 IB]